MRFVPGTPVAGIIHVKFGREDCVAVAQGKIEILAEISPQQEHLRRHNGNQTSEGRAQAGRSETRR
jgi:hypothetical protein